MKLGIIGIVGEEAKKDFWGTMSRLAEMGYQGVEAIEPTLLEGDPASNLRRFNDLGLEHLTVSASREDLRDHLDEIRQKAISSGAKRVSMWWSEANDRDILLQEAELYENASRVLAGDGLKLCYHNHDQEFRNVFGDKSAFDLLVENTSLLCFTVDVGWVSVGGADPAVELAKVKGRVPAIHAKDFRKLSDRDSFTCVGTGSVDFNASLDAAREAGVDWVIVEQDRLRNLSPFDTALASALNLRERGL